MIILDQIIIIPRLVHLCERRQAVRGARGVRDNVVALGVVLGVVNPHH